MNEVNTIGVDIAKRVFQIHAADDAGEPVIRRQLRRRQVLPFFERLPAWAHYRGLMIPDDCPRLSAWIATMSQLASVQQIRNDADYYIEHYIGYAKEVLAA